MKDERQSGINKLVKDMVILDVADGGGAIYWNIRFNTICQALYLNDWKFTH